jgi:hypothetical protein
MKSRIVISMGLCLLVLSGCGGPANVGRVSGTVKLDGQPLPDANVTFSPVTKGSSALGRTDSSGQYTLQYTAGASGAELGENRVSISTYDAGNADADPPRPAIKEKVPAEYNSKTKLKADVKEGNNTFDWDLKSGGPIADPEGGTQAASGRCE